MTDALVVAVPPRLSVTVSPIVYVPSAGNVYDEVTPDPHHPARTSTRTP